MVSRREILKGGLGLAGILANGQCPAFVKGIVAAHSTSLMGEMGGFDNPYLTDGLVAMFDGEWNSRNGTHGDNSIIVDSTGNCGSLSLSSGSLSHDTAGLYCTSAATLVCSENSKVNKCVSDVVYNNTKSVVLQLVCSVKDVPSRNRVSFSSIGEIGSSYPCFSLSCEKIPTVPCMRGSAWSCSQSQASQVDIRGNQYNTATVQMELIGGMQYRTLITDDFWNNVSVDSYKTSQLASRLPNEPNLVRRCITTGVVSLKLPAGAKFYAARVYNRTLTAEEISVNSAIDKERFGL